MPIKNILVVSLLLICLLSACAPAAPTQQQAPAYPPPGNNGSTEQPIGLYPELSDGAEIPWGQAKAMIKHGDVDKIAKGQGLEFVLSLKDGRSFKSVQLEEGALDGALQECGDVCSHIQISG